MSNCKSCEVAEKTCSKCGGTGMRGPGVAQVRWPRYYQAENMLM